MVERWLLWITSLSTEQILVLLAPILLLDAPRYALGTLAVWVCDFCGDLLKSLTGRSVTRQFHHQPRCCAIVAGLNEADLMRRVLAPTAYSAWLDQFFPHLASGKCGNLLVPVSVSDVTDGHLVHLAGLNLARAWTMNGIAKALKDELQKAWRTKK